ncbi:MAG: hypothetical protein HQL57_08315 [Magnetococcales bacterium]|nr:hypothetical protein [Magnetococcales bacterium]MBF0157170.1 hypothetical protein [Magnetococcales bacterium]
MGATRVDSVRRRVRRGAGAVLAPLLAFGLFWGGTGFAAGTGGWLPLREDKLHDPEGPSIGELQEPAAALGALPPDEVGNKVRWVKALADGVIKPRTNIMPETKINVLDLDIVFGNTGDRAYVRFPHKQHTEWLDCSNCHPGIFAEKFGGSKITMAAILEGTFCGQCHGAVAFPLTECNRCHSVNPDTFTGELGPQPKP